LDGTHTRQYGLVAEEVAELAPELVMQDETGAPQTVRYHFVNAMLLNEVQKQRRYIEEQRGLFEEQRQSVDEQRRQNKAQETTIARLEERLAKLEAALTADR
jgi:polyhydroxyalkanoate synthesis regulator phasin